MYNTFLLNDRIIDIENIVLNTSHNNGLYFRDILIFIYQEERTGKLKSTE